MRVVVQRVAEASVHVDGRLVGSAGRGILVLVGIARGDAAAEIQWMADKVLDLRIFKDEEDRMNKSVLDVGGDVLAVSQFTLLGDASKGRRPSFIEAADPVDARRSMGEFVAALRKRCTRVETGEFGARMSVALVNDGPVTIVIDRTPSQPGAVS